jgi:TLD
MFLPRRIKNFELIFRAGQHNFSAIKFHEFCDKKFPTLTLFLSDKNKYFGGFTTSPWLSSADDLKDEKWRYFSAPGTFLFSLDKKKRYDLINQVDSEAICCDISYGPTFGYDLIVCDQSDQYKKSVNHLGWNYQLKDSISSTVALTEEKYFLLLEYEVFMVNFQKTITLD